MDQDETGPVGKRAVPRVFGTEINDVRTLFFQGVFGLQRPFEEKNYQ